jgi:thiol-disulfide isomerase/thioredoxin
MSPSHCKYVSTLLKIILCIHGYRCPPCKRIAPVFAKISAENSSVKFIKVDIDQLPDAASGAGIQSVPTFQFRIGKDKKFEVCYSLDVCSFQNQHS